LRSSNININGANKIAVKETADYEPEDVFAWGFAPVT
jgi:hypothetical protein